jgi:hypothetical protein
MLKITIMETTSERRWIVQGRLVGPWVNEVRTLQFSGNRSQSSILEIDCWMPSEVRAISPLVDRLMGRIEGSQCVPGEEFDIELALREALDNAVVHGNQEDPAPSASLQCLALPCTSFDLTGRHSRHSQIDASCSAFTRRVLTPLSVLPSGQS